MKKGSLIVFTWSLGGEDGGLSGGFDLRAKISSYFGGGVQYPFGGVLRLKPTGGNCISSAGATGGLALGFGDVGGGDVWSFGNTGTYQRHKGCYLQGWSSMVHVHEEIWLWWISHKI